MLVIGAELKSTKNSITKKGLKKATEGCTITRWRLPGKQFGLMMRMTNDP